MRFASGAALLCGFAGRASSTDPSWTYDAYGAEWSANYPYCAGAAAPGTHVGNEWQSPIDLPAAAEQLALPLPPAGPPPAFDGSAVGCEPQRVTSGHSWELHYDAAAAPSCSDSFRARFRNVTCVLRRHLLCVRVVPASASPFRAGRRAA